MNTSTKLVALLLTWQLAASAQDFHLSQYDATPHYYNPALTGVYFGDQADYRIYSDYRSQWKSLGIKPFSTFYLAYDMPYKGKYGLGGYLLSNRNGASGFNTINFFPSAAYKITNEVSSPHNLSVGLQMGIMYKSFKPGDFTYNNQYSPDSPTGFDTNLPSGETFPKTNLLKFDANMGVFYKYKYDSWKAHPFAGFSVYHVARPNQTLTGYAKDRIPMRWIAQAGCDWKINSSLSLQPMLLYMLQSKAHELMIGSLVFYEIKDTKYNLLGGLSYRIKDALIVQAGLQYEKHIFAISYDINTSYLNNYTNRRGGFEFTLILTGIKGKPLFNPKFRGHSVLKSI